MFHHWSLRQRLWSILGLTFFGLLAMVITDRITTEHLNRELAAVEQGYVPLLKYGPELEAAFNKLSRSMLDAVSAQDPDALSETRLLRDEIIEMLGNAPPAVDSENIERLTVEFISWSDKAYRLSVEMLQGHSGERLVKSIKDMQEAKQASWGLLKRTVFLDESALARAFGNARGAQQTAAETRIIFCLILFLVIAALMLIMGHRVLQAFSELLIGFARFGKGDFSKPVLIQGEDELAELGFGANQMAYHIDELQNNLKQANKELESFSYSVSHDLRAPLRGIDGFSQALLEDYENSLDETGQHYLHRVRAAAQRMGELIDDLLALSRTGRASVTRTHVDISTLAARVAKQMDDSDPSRKVQWVITEGIHANADQRLLTVVLENLLGNAWKFTKKKPHAQIEFGKHSDAEGEAYFVRDNGAGFDMTYADKLFGAFQRLHRDTEFEGTGIGLATVSRIIRKHGGRIWAEGQPEHGATFFFTLNHAEEIS
ncbi:MAG: ATP-binding protein [Myxococcota bacterium]